MLIQLYGMARDIPPKVANVWFSRIPIRKFVLATTALRSIFDLTNLTMASPKTFTSLFDFDT